MKTIGVYADSFEGKITQNAAYIDWISRRAHVRLITPWDDLNKVKDQIDILLVPGGLDVSPSITGDIPSVFNGRANPFYEYLDNNLLKAWLEDQKPTIGICRGMQVINVLLGGSLYQHVAGHIQDPKLSRGSTSQEMQTIYSNQAMKSNAASVKINSYHHQAVKDVAPGFTVLGWSRVYTGCPSLSNENIQTKTWFQKRKNSSAIDALEDVPVCVELMKNEQNNILLAQFHPEEFECGFFDALASEMFDI